MAKPTTRNLSNYPQEFKKELEAMGDNRWPLRDVFDDFLFMSSTALRQTVNQFTRGKIDPQLEQDMRDRLKPKYKVPNDFSKAFAVLTMSLEEHPHDFLGEFYGAIAATNAASGQFFTPSPVAAMSAKMTLDRSHFLKTLKRGQRFSVCEPAAGAGCMIIECAKVLREWGARTNEFYVDASDIDKRCVMMCYVQCSLLHVPAIVRHQNTLSLEQWDAWPTLALAMNPVIPPAQPPRKPIRDR